MRHLLISLLLIFQVGCASTVITRAEDHSFNTQNARTHHLFFWGWWEASPPISLNDLCGENNWSKIQTQYSILNVAIGILTVGIYTPVTVHVHCATVQSRK